MRYLLVDNGSLRTESVLNLRRVARELSDVAGVEIVPASLLHSNRIDPAELNGEAAINLERRLRLWLEAGERNFAIIPFFFGPTGAIVDYLPQRVAFLREKYGDFHIERTPFLYDAGDTALGEILTDRIKTLIAREELERPRIVLVDHGSPLPEVTAVRDALAAQLKTLLGEGIEEITPASMERREGPEYDFNEPLLERLLRQSEWKEGTVVVSMLFLSPGRHAGPGGDVDQICQDAMRASPALKTYMTDLVGTHVSIVDLLSKRMAMPRMPVS